MPQIEARGWCKAAIAGHRRATASSRSRPTTRDAWNASRPVVGSSASSALVMWRSPGTSSPTIAQATARRRRSPLDTAGSPPLLPPLSARCWPTRRSATDASPTRSSKASARAAAAAVGNPSSSAANWRVSRTVSSEKKGSCCSRSATVPSATPTCDQLPSSTTLPRTSARGGSTPAMALSSVDLPAPEGPSTPRRRPARATPLVAWRSTRPLEVTSRSRQ
mmetsp:Transcript_62777/g.178452  ORF Transcript_62777/g.178452 Transcript_62777/m.178452 type:complete len:221 (-) Transcript_62777:3-665(-)